MSIDSKRPFLKNEQTEGAAPPPKPRGRTGPTTNAGKAKSSRNSLKHGIFSPHPVVIEGLETIEDWEQFEREIVESWDTEGRYEQELAERIAFLQWRLRRCRHHETAVLNIQVRNTSDDLLLSASRGAGSIDDVPDPDPMRVFAYQQLRIIPGELSIDRILQYETTIHRLLISTVHQLEAHQARRRRPERRPRPLRVQLRPKPRPAQVDNPVARISPPRSQLIRVSARCKGRTVEDPPQAACAQGSG